jgi:hypothetical protein
MISIVPECFRSTKTFDMFELGSILLAFSLSWTFLSGRTGRFQDHFFSEPLLSRTTTFQNHFFPEPLLFRKELWSSIDKSSALSIYLYQALRASIQVSTANDLGYTKIFDWFQLWISLIKHLNRQTTTYLTYLCLHEFVFSFMFAHRYFLFLLFDKLA